MLQPRNVLKSGRFHFCTIGLGTINYRGAARRLAREAFETGLFSSSYGNDEKFIRENCPLFWEQHKSILKARVPGFGYWLWKPTYISKVLDLIPENDVLLYLDSGSSIGKSLEDRLELMRYMNLGKVNDLVGSNSQSFKEKYYCSSDYLDFRQTKDSDRESNQFYGGFLIVKNSERGRSLVEEWRRVACQENHRLYFMNSGFASQIDGFVHHMYDQALLSPLLKSYAASNVLVGDKFIDAPVRMIRHRFAYKVSERNPAIVGFYKSAGFFSKVYLAVQRRTLRKTQNLCQLEHE